MALAYVVKQVGNALCQTLALCFEGFFLRFGIERQIIARRHRSNPLLHTKTDARTGFFIRFNRLGQLGHGARVQQIGSSRKSCQRILCPTYIGKTPILGSHLALQTFLPQLRGFLQVLGLQGLQFFWSHAHWHGRFVGAQIHFLERLQCL